MKDGLGDHSSKDVGGGLSPLGGFYCNTGGGGRMSALLFPLQSAGKVHMGQQMHE